MLEAIVQIGDAILKEGSLLSSLIQELSPTRKGKQLNVLKLNFDLDNNRLLIDTKEEMSEETASKYLFVGSADGPSSPQWFVSSTSINYHLSETIFNLTKIDLGKETNTHIRKVFQEFFIDVSPELKDKYRYMLDLHKLGIISDDIRDIYNGIEEDGKKGKKLLDKLVKGFDAYLKANMDTSIDQIGLFVICINGVPLSDSEFYREAVLKAKQPKERKKKAEDIRECSLCGSRSNVTADMSKMRMKYYTTNQLIFASGLDRGNYDKNMLLCNDCLNKLQAGEMYVYNKLSVKLAGFDVYIIPHFVYGEPMNKEDMDIVAEKINYSFNSTKAIESVEKLRDEIILNTDLRNDESYFLINFVFYKQNQKATKIQRLIKDVNPSIFYKINIARNDLMKEFKTLLGDNLKISLGLETVYQMIPVRLKDGSNIEYKDVMEAYDALFTCKTMNKAHVIENAVGVFKTIRLEKTGYNINPKSNLEFKILQSNMYIKFLQHMGCLKEGKAVDVSSMNFKQDIKDYITSMGFGEQEAALFLMGILIGEIGNSQYKRTDGQKPILNKLNFNGIDKAKIKRLKNEVLNKLTQEKIRNFNEMTYSQMSMLLDANINNWKLNKDENLFYILSGYAYATAQPMLKEGNKNE